MTKDEIIAAIRKAAADNGGVPLGRQRFFAQTGIREADWLGKHWTRWSQALRDAGFSANQLQAARTDDDVLGSLAELARELGHFPVTAELRLRARSHAGFPSHNTVARYGGKAQLAARLRQFCLERGDVETAALCAPFAEVTASPEEDGEFAVVGYVYLVRHGRRAEYKIGRTNNPLRREGEIRTELPEQLVPVHHIATDDPAGIENYWHRRFAAKRKNGEWFALDVADVRAFKRWRRIA